MLKIIINIGWRERGAKWRVEPKVSIICINYIGIHV